MGNSLACGCGSDHPKGYGDTPYSKKMSKNLIRFWAEVFLLAQDGSGNKTEDRKWQLVVPKLVPINVARVQDTPAVVSHITAYNTKIDKVMDVIVYHPGMDIYRGSECFVFWSDPQKGLTWGLNFITPDDASYFTDLVCGRTKGILSRRANSSSSLVSKQKNARPRSTSIPVHEDIRSKVGGSKHSVKFADPPVSKSADHSRQTTPTPLQRTLSQSGGNSRESSQPPTPDPFTLYMTGKRLSDWRTMMPGSESTETLSAHNPLKHNPPPHIPHYSGEPRSGVWRKEAGRAGLTISLDSAALQKMLHPIANKPPHPHPQLTSAGSSSESLPHHSQPRYTSHAHITPPTLARKHYSSAGVPDSSSSVSSIDTGRSVDPGDTPPEVLLTQNQMALPIKGTPRTKRSSIHLVTGENGRFRNVGENRPSPHPMIFSPTLPSTSHQHPNLEDNGSWSSSVSSPGRGTSQTSSMTGMAGVPKILGQKIRKAGFLLLKRWLQPQDHQLSIMNSESWEQYWALLKGFNVHFYSVVSATGITKRDSGSSAGSTPDEPSQMSEKPPIVIDLLNCLVQPIPEYPRRENVFCLSTGVGQAFLLQVSSESEVESWTQGIHTGAALALARTTSKEVGARTLRKELEKLDQKIETVSKMIRLSRLPSVGTVSVNQVADWESEYELLHTQHFISRCYLSALKHTELPSGKKVLSSASPGTKLYLSQMGIFAVSSMHAFIFSRSTARYLPSPSHPSSSTNASVKGSSPSGYSPGNLSSLNIRLPKGQMTVLSMGERESCGDFLVKVCEKVCLPVKRHFLLFRKTSSPNEVLIPDDAEFLHSRMSDYSVELREKLVYHVHLNRDDDPNGTLGLTVRALRSHSTLEGVVTSVEKGGLAERKGLILGDQLLAINHRKIRGLASAEVEQLLQESKTLCLVLRSRRISLPTWLAHLSGADSQESLCLECEGGAGLGEGAGEAVGGGGKEEEWYSDTGDLHRHKVKYRPQRGSFMSKGRQRYSLPIIPPPTLPSLGPRESSSAQSSPYHFDKRHSLAGSNLAKRISSSEPGAILTNGGGALRASGKLGQSERLEKILFEMVETEKAYVEDLDKLLYQYLRPLRENRLLRVEEVERLVSSSESIFRFQRSFLEELREATGADCLPDSSPNTSAFSTPSHLRNSLLRMGGVFLNASSKFKVYSGFSAAHFRVQKFLNSNQGNDVIMGFLDKCNAERQHSTTFQSYLIKPIQRVLRYPLFLQQIKALTNQHTAEHLQVSEALIKMEKVAEYINEMQRIYEEYGTVLSEVQSQHADVSKKQLSLELSELLMFGEVEWLNAVEDNGRKRQSPSYECLCFVFRSVILLLPQNDRPSKGKKKNSQHHTQQLIPIAEVEVNGSNLGSTDNQYIWILIHMDHALRVEKVYHFANRRLEVKQQFLRAIRKAGLQQSLVVEKERTTVVEERAASSPDSGLPPAPISSRLLNGGVVDVERRPGSYYSSQSDAGYGSNNELHKKEALAQGKHVVSVGNSSV